MSIASAFCGFLVSHIIYKLYKTFICSMHGFLCDVYAQFNTHGVCEIVSESMFWW